MTSNITYQGSTAIDDEELVQLEKLTAFNLPDFVRELLNKYSGSEPRINDRICLIDVVYEDGYQDTVGLLRIESPATILENWNYRGYLNNFKEHFELEDSYVEIERLFPIIELTDGQLYVAIGGQHDGKVYCVDNGDFGITYLAGSLQELFKKIYAE